MGRQLLNQGNTIETRYCSYRLLLQEKGLYFSSDKREIFSQNPLYLNLFTKTTAEWTIIQNTLNAITHCDFAVPFKIEIKENNSTRSFSLKRFSNSYPATVKQMESLELYFNNLK